MNYTADFGRRRGGALAWLALASVAAVLGIGGCTSHQIAAQDPALQQRIAQDLPVVGLWSEAVGGMRCRMLLERDMAQETDTIRAAMVIENVSDRSATIAHVDPAAPEHAADWRADGLAIGGHVSATEPARTSGIRLAPKETFILGPTALLMPPVPGPRMIWATLSDESGVLKAPPVGVMLAPATWGEAADGVRIRLAADKAVYSVGEPIRLSLFIHNMGSKQISIHPPAWDTLDSEDRRDLTTFSCHTDDNQSAQVDAGLCWTGSMPDGSPLAPGKYRLRFVLTSPELSIKFARAWHGQVTSNEVQVEVHTQLP